MSQRAHNAAHLNEFIEAILDSNADLAMEILHAEMVHYPVYYTRSLQEARAWLREKREGAHQIGMLASSGAKRLKHYGLDVSGSLNMLDWLLRMEHDVRSASYLERAANERKIQGMELDWSCVCWGADLRHDATGWHYLKFAGNAWENIEDDQEKTFLLNRYRILLSRAKNGMVIWVPPGDEFDKSTLPRFYNGVAEFMQNCGIPKLTMKSPQDEETAE